MEIVALIILVIASLVGFAAIFFTTFGTLIMLIGAVLFTVLTEFTILSPKSLLILLFLYLCGEVTEYLFIIIGAKKLGASNRAVFGALIGGVIGAAMGAHFLGIGLIFGAFLGIFLGAFTVEYTIHHDLVTSLKAGTGGVLGRIGSVAAKVLIAVIMLFIIGRDLLNYY